MERDTKRDIGSLPGLQADERVRYGHHQSHFFDLWRPAERATRFAAVMIHGGFWRVRYDLRHASYLCAALASNGIAVANLEYRRVGEPGGGWPGTFKDVLAGVRSATHRLGEPPVVIGHSAGGHLALRLAAEPVHIRGVVALAPVADLGRTFELNLSNGAVVDFLGGTPVTVPQLYEAACPSRHSSALRRFIIHGAKDDVVPVEISRGFVESRKADPEPPSLIEIPEAGHFDLIDPESAAWPVVKQSLMRLLSD